MIVMPEQECRRCSMCGISYPSAIYRCQVCGENCDYGVGVAPDADWQEKVRLARGAGDMSRDLTEEEEVGAWRYLQLLDAGYDAPAACRIAADFQIDLHQACELLEHECPLETAVAILL